MRRYKPAQKKDDESLSPELLDNVIDDQVRRGVAPLAPLQPTLLFVPRVRLFARVRRAEALMHRPLARSNFAGFSSHDRESATSVQLRLYLHDGNDDCSNARFV